jgi:DNA-binding protein Fis
METEALLIADDNPLPPILEQSSSETGSKTSNIEGLKNIVSALWKEVEALGNLQPLDIRTGIDFYNEVRRYEIHLIRRALDHTGGNQKRAAKLLGIKVTTLNTIIHRYSIIPHRTIETESCP